jgi:hypothetical protein
MLCSGSKKSRHPMMVVEAVKAALVASISP